ncbi:MAG: TRIC cation channel family protein [Bacteroidota bacterium]|nr:TRIC cation channel family protein [Bacteroidota bacterium]
MISLDPNSALIHFIEIAGLISFGISGGMAAPDKKLDVFGILIIAFSTTTFRRNEVPS